MHKETGHFVVRACCPACGWKEHVTIYSRDFQDAEILNSLKRSYPALRSIDSIETSYLIGARFILDECKKCELVYQREIPDDFLTEKLYEEWIDPKYSYAQQVKNSLQYHANHARDVMTIIGYFNVEPTNLEFLDVGMGWGELCLMGKAFGCNTSGIELSQSRIDHAKSIGINVIPWNELHNYKFDFINADQLFEHVPKPLETLRSLESSLKPKGLIKISVPSGRDVKRRLEVSDWTAPKGTRNSLNLVDPLQHINCFKRSSLLMMAEIAGLEEVKIPIYLQYVYSTMWKPFVPFLKNLARPIYYNLLRTTYVFFRHKALR